MDGGWSIVFEQPAEPFRYQTLDAEYEEGAARYMAHARQQMADGKLDHARCSLRKAAHKARQAKRLRRLLNGF